MSAPQPEPVFVRHIRSLIGATHADYVGARGQVHPGEYEVVGYNSMRRVVLVLAVEAPSATEAVHRADRWVERAGKVRPNVWTTRPGL